MARALLACMALALLAARGEAQTLVATATIRAQTILGPADVAVADAATPGALTDPAAAIGMEARVNLYANRPIRAADLRAPAVIERNEIVTLRFDASGLTIVTEGRALDRAGVGDRLQVMNLASRNMVTGQVVGPALVAVGPPSLEHP